jgi:hypothetical protein
VGYGEEVEGVEAQQPCERYGLALDSIMIMLQA